MESILSNIRDLFRIRHVEGQGDVTERMLYAYHLSDMIRLARDAGERIEAHEEARAFFDYLFRISHVEEQGDAPEWMLYAYHLSDMMCLARDAGKRIRAQEEACAFFDYLLSNDSNPELRDEILRGTVRMFSQIKRCCDGLRDRIAIARERLGIPTPE